MDNLRQGQILRKVQPSKTEPGRNRKYEQIKSSEIETDLIISNKQESRTRWLHIYQTFTEELIPLLLKHFQKIAEKLIL